MLTQSRATVVWSKNMEVRTQSEPNSTLENVYQKHLVYAYALPHASHASTLARTARMHALTVFYTSYITISHVISIFLPDSPPGIF